MKQQKRVISILKSLLTHFFKIPLSFGEEDPEAEGPPPKTPVRASAIFAIVNEKAVSTDIIVMPCSRNKVQILSTKDPPLSSSNFLMVH